MQVLEWSRKRKRKSASIWGKKTEDWPTERRTNRKKSYLIEHQESLLSESSTSPGPPCWTARSPGPGSASPAASSWLSRELRPRRDFLLYSDNLLLWMVRSALTVYSMTFRWVYLCTCVLYTYLKSVDPASVDASSSLTVSHGQVSFNCVLNNLSVSLLLYMCTVYIPVNLASVDASSSLPLWSGPVEPWVGVPPIPTSYETILTNKYIWTPQPRF